VLEASDVKKLRRLKAANARLKRMLAEREMAIHTLKEINRRKWWARRCVESRWPWQFERGHSQRRACELIQISTTVLGYQPTGHQRDAPVIDATRRLARQYPRVGE
jgi:hypothetical protein